MAAWQPAYVGIGSNLEDPHSQVVRAAAALARLPQSMLILRSPLYGSRPLGPVAQPDFVNAVAGLLTRLEPLVLLRELRSLERAFGRPAEHEKWGPRVLDLDLLVHGRAQRATPELTLPHPGIVARNFVLYPLADIAPDLQVPGLGRVAELKGHVSPQGIWPIASGAHGAPTATRSAHEGHAR
ncbi:MAG TPA: 2-amino-4-hydroxy-6-hydroxymethyldihydropteridine diphosphokinase [Steroidobacteraceae bacterium]|nr:2-amino-4-hydroxy-6-hydroxymethyldihydropteridine diphosphokinase [Steroidobacteraceae bacterium]